MPIPCRAPEGRFTCWWTARPEALWARRMVDREAWHEEASVLAQAAHRHRCRDRADPCRRADDQDVDDGSQVEPLLDQIAGPLASFIGDGAYDQAGIYGTIGKRHPDADVIVPPRSTAVLSEDVPRPLRPSVTGISRALPSMDASAGRRVRVHSSCPGGVSHQPVQTSDWSMLRRGRTNAAEPRRPSPSMS